jgi:integrase
MRLGELLALTWRGVDLVEAVIHVRRTYSDGVVGPTKNHEKREVDLTDELVELLGEWWGTATRRSPSRSIPTTTGSAQRGARKRASSPASSGLTVLGQFRTLLDGEIGEGSTRRRSRTL